MLRCLAILMFTNCDAFASYYTQGSRVEISLVISHLPYAYRMYEPFVRSAPVMPLHPSHVCSSSYPCTGRRGRFGTATMSSM